MARRREAEQPVGPVMHAQNGFVVEIAHRSPSDPARRRRSRILSIKLIVFHLALAARHANILAPGRLRWFYHLHTNELIRSSTLLRRAGVMANRRAR
jgi:hypothetical protein